MTTSSESPHPAEPSGQLSLDSVFAPPSRRQWVEMAVAGLDVAADAGEEALRHLRRTTLEGIPLDVLCDAADVTVTLPPDSAVNDRGQIQCDNRLSVDARGPGVELVNARILDALRGGISSIELYSPSAGMLAGALKNVQLDIATISLRAGADYENSATALKALASTQNIDDANLRCSFNADPVGTALSTGTGKSSANNTPVATQLEDMAHFAIATNKNIPQAHSVLIDTAIHHNAGASTIEELHAALATAMLYLEAMLDAGMNLTDASGQIIFQVAMDADVLLGVAKLRSLRALWLHTLQQVDNQKTDQGGSSKPVFIVAETSRRYTSKLEPWNNHLRNLSACTAAFLGNANALIVHPHDALLRSELLRSDKGSDTALGDRIARNIAIILERESGLSRVHDPMAGSYAVENLTQQLMQHCWQSLATTDTGEGWLDELYSGRWQTRLAHTHRQRVTLMEKEQRITVGVNRFVQSENFEPETIIDKQLPSEQTTGENATTDSSILPMSLTLVREAEAFEQALAQEATS